MAEDGGRESGWIFHQKSIIEQYSKRGLNFLLSPRDYRCYLGNTSHPDNSAMAPFAQTEGQIMASAPELLRYDAFLNSLFRKQRQACVIMV